MKTGQTPAAENEKLLRMWVQFFTNVWLRVRTKNAESCRSRLQHSRSARPPLV